ncbi:hypothetical protein HELRODRAFT_167422 [Helobdella robusta]|uniref:Uncharacterized protein n=1 Tax=Helobdella robusta TaxID=6412 RepID=T1EZC6_HELRO|nr:hypothetical protein HELRODRAFT_167422 [Helobdella robusta]ESO10910.1 hypothetical protein HELRODRAFT_167422 [Helobdella robusta]
MDYAASCQCCTLSVIATCLAIFYILRWLLLNYFASGDSCPKSWTNAKNLNSTRGLMKVKIASSHLSNGYKADENNNNKINHNNNQQIQFSTSLSNKYFANNNNYNLNTKNSDYPSLKTAQICCRKISQIDHVEEISNGNSVDNTHTAGTPYDRKEISQVRGINVYDLLSNTSTGSSSIPHEIFYDANDHHSPTQKWKCLSCYSNFTQCDCKVVIYKRRKGILQTVKNKGLRVSYE